MEYILTGALVYVNGGFEHTDMYVRDGRIFRIAPDLSSEFPMVESFDLSQYVVFPGFVDVHVHFREPGFVYKETIVSGCASAARGGYTHVCTMPNLFPVPDSVDNMKLQLDAIERSATVHVYPYAAITVGERGEDLVPMEELADKAIAFSDDGRGVQSREMMLEAMKRSRALGKMIVAHCEDNSLLLGGCIHDGEFAKKNGLPGICSESEWGPIARDIELVRKSGCSYHVCHVSTKESVELIRRAKSQGLDITCETAPHYLTLCDTDMKDEGRFKMNPPLRSEEDRRALIEGILDGTVDMIATDHAPHSAEEKSRGLRGSLMGVVGLECAFPVLYTSLVGSGIITLAELVRLMSDNPRRRFGIGNEIREGEAANLCVFDLDSKYKIDPNDFATMGRSTPFEGREVYGKCKMTIVDGRIVWQANLIEK